jgi:oxygen-independent coproporphyrinogen-3 oxidase
MTRERTGLTASLLASDALVFGLRMNAGVDLSPLMSRCPGAPWERVGALVDRLVDEGLAARAGDLVRLSQRGRLLADAVGSEVMAAFDPKATPVGCAWAPR